MTTKPSWLRDDERTEIAEAEAIVEAREVLDRLAKLFTRLEKLKLELDFSVDKTAPTGVFDVVRFKVKKVIS
jgi:hypothetical protein